MRVTTRSSSFRKYSRAVAGRMETMAVCPTKECEPLAGSTSEE